ncbi:MAG: hypothetical protein ACRD1R_11555, partial [Acidobacteriota bacterium]
YDGTQGFNGIIDFEQAYQQATAAWKALKNVQIDSAYTPPIQFHRPTRILLDELKGHVEAIAKYMQFLKDQQKGTKNPIEVPRARGPFEYYERMQFLNPGQVYWPRTVVQ